MGASAGRPKGPISNINVTPFVDVVLVLLVIFMITAPTLLRETLAIRLPEVETPSEKKSELVEMGLAVNAQGQFLLNGEIADLERIKREAARLTQQRSDAKAIISADREARHGDVIQLIDAIRAAGLTRFAFEIQRSDRS